jgi:uncharacterized coiled-coil protein SlyX
MQPSFDLSAAQNASSDQKLDMLLAAMGTLLESQAKIEKLTTTVCSLETKVASQEVTITTMQKEMKRMKEQLNDYDQQSRTQFIRLFNFPMADDDTAADSGRALANRVYDRILKPIIVAAKAKNDITTVPQCANVIEDIYRVGKPSLKDGVQRPPPIIIRLCTKQLRLAILKNKKTSIPSPTTQERAAGIKRFVLVEDLTPHNYKKLSELLADDRIEKAWSVEGRLRFVLTGSDKSVKKVKSVYDSVDHIVSSVSF